jgi:regulator of protease activity HflC (stomatin/prohibitin superfamily)
VGIIGIKLKVRRIYMGIFVILVLILLIVLFSSVKVVKEWEKLAILTLGRFTGMKGPGLVLIFPIIQKVASRIDIRVLTSKFQSETTLTKDGVSVTVQAVLFWKVRNPQKATLAVSNYRDSVELAAQTTLRDIIGRVTLADILSNLNEIDGKLKESIAAKISDWGIDAISVEIRDVSIPQQLQEVMSRSAQAEREKQARIIYGEAEIEAAKKFVEASNIYNETSNSLQLRAMSIMYEAVKSDQNTIIIVPSNLADSFNSVAMTNAVNSAINNNKAKIADKTDR